MATDPVQRRWSAACPNCGATVAFASSASASAVCSFCRSTLLREGDALRRIGQSAELFKDFSPLQLGARGRYAGAAFTLIGRLQLVYEGGSWNEWHALFDDSGAQQKAGWLSEDNGSFVFAFDAPLADTPPAAEALVLGAQQVLGGQGWRVASLTRARIAAAEGELPRPPRLDAPENLVADLRSAQDEVATLDYGSSPPQWSVGRAVRLADLGLSGLRDDSGATLASRVLPCPSCGAALEPRLDTTKSIVCGQCHAVVDVSSGAGADLAHYAQANGNEPQLPQLPLGAIGQLALTTGGTALPWQVVGYQERCDLPEPGGDEEQVFWREYLLYNRLEGFAFLVDSEEGWSLVRPLTGAPRPLGGGAVEWQGRRFRQRWRYTAKTVYVLGEFYWRVQQEDRCEVTDYEGDALALSSERSGQELTWSLGRKLDAAEVMSAFRLADGRKGAIARDVGAFRADTGMLRKATIATAVIVLLVVLMSTCSRDECQNLKDTYGAASAEYQQCRSRGGSGLRAGSRGGSWGGGGSSGGGHK